MRKWDSAGYTLIELLVATGVMGLMGLATAASFGLLNQVKQNAQSIADVQELESLLKKQLASPTSCRQVMAAEGSLANPTTGPVITAGVGSEMDYTVYKFPSSSAQVLFYPKAALSPTQNVYGAIRVDQTRVELYRISSGTNAKQAVGALHLSISRVQNAAVNREQLNRSQTYEIYLPVGMLLDSTNRLKACASVGIDLAVPQCTAGQHLVLQVQSGSPNPTQWVCQ